MITCYFQFRNEVKDKLEVKQKELTDCKKESRKRKKMIAVYQVGWTQIYICSCYIQVDFSRVMGWTLDLAVVLPDFLIEELENRNVDL